MMKEIFIALAVMAGAAILGPLLALMAVRVLVYIATLFT